MHPFPVVAKKAPANDPVAEIEAPCRRPRRLLRRPHRLRRSLPGEEEVRGRFILPVIGLALLAGGAWYGYDYWVDGRFMVTTDDAYVEAEMAFVSPKITGYVASRPAAKTRP